MRFVPTTLGCALGLALMLDAGCRPATPGGPAVAVPEAIACSTERAQFDRLFHQWQTLVGELQRLDRDFRIGSEERRSRLKEQYAALVEDGKALEEQLIDAATLACVEEPEENTDLADFLAGVAVMLAETEQYEQSLRMAQLLLDHELRCGRFQPRVLHDLAGQAAFVVGQFDLAEQHLKRAEESHALSDLGKQYLGEIPYYQEAWRREEKLRTSERMAGDLPRVLLETTQGNIELELFEKEAPNTVANFIALVGQGFYDGLPFFRVLPRSMAQAGCPKGDGSGGPGHVIECECYRSDHRVHFRGSLGMLHRGPHTGGSQFYLAFLPMKQFDGNHTVFGRIVRGLDVLAKLQRRDPPTPESLRINPFPNVYVPPADTIRHAKVLRKRNHPYKPKVYPIPERKAAA